MNNHKHITKHQTDIIRNYIQESTYLRCLREQFYYVTNRVLPENIVNNLVNDTFDKCLDNWSKRESEAKLQSFKNYDNALVDDDVMENAINDSLSAYCGRMGLDSVRIITRVNNRDGMEEYSLDYVSNPSDYSESYCREHLNIGNRTPIEGRTRMGHNAIINIEEDRSSLSQEESCHNFGRKKKK